VRNKALYIFFIVLIALVAIAAYFHFHYANKDSIGIFIVTALAAIGTCGVTILTVFPYEPRDNLDAEVSFRKNKQIWLTIENKTNHTIYLGSDNYSISDYGEDYAVWWVGEKKENNLKHLFVSQGDNLAITPKGKIYYIIDRKVFSKNPLDKIQIQIRTSSVYRFNVKNKLREKSVK